MDYLDILQIHNGPAPSPPRLEGRSYTQLWIEDYLRPGGALEGLQRVLRDGKARYLGFICRGNDGYQVRQLIDTSLFRMINVPYTLLNPTAGMARPRGLEVDRDFGEVINYAYEHGVGAAIYSPLAGGFLTDHIVAGGDRHPLAGARDTASEAYRRHLEMARALSFLRREGTAYPDPGGSPLYPHAPGRHRGPGRLFGAGAPGGNRPGLGRRPPGA